MTDSNAGESTEGTSKPQQDERVRIAVSHWAPRFVANGVDLSDFTLALPAPYAAQGYGLQINGKKLQLAQVSSVPDGGNTLLMLGCVVGCLGYFSQRRPANR